MLTFNPRKSCPKIAHFECVQADCGFWDADKSVCVIQHGLVSLTDYQSFTSALLPSWGWVWHYSLGIFKNFKIITSFNDCELQFAPPSQGTIQLYKKWGRLGNWLTFKNINGQYFAIRSVGTIPYSGMPGYAEYTVDTGEGGI